MHVAQAVERAAIGHREAVGADRGDAAGQQVDLAGERSRCGRPQRDVAQRRAHHAALVHGGRGEPQAAEHRVRLRGQRGRGIDALDGQAARRIELAHQRAVLIDPTALAHEEAAAVVHCGVDLRSCQRQVAGRVEGGRLRQAKVAAASHRDLIEGLALDHQRLGHVLDDGAARAGVDHPDDVDQLRIERQARALGHQRDAERAAAGAAVLRAAHRVRHDVVVGLRACAAGQADVGRRQVDLRAGRGVGGQVDGAGGQAQALAQAQVDAAVEAHQAVGHQREVVEAAAGDAVHADARVPVGQCGLALAGLQAG
ncbi:hypothetical protein D9M68_663120 [compost metagenome]